ncbi:ArsR/SmtB family transcription factor [Georhizobium sp. MAB10]|uniref:ArsR/SmtB family transcription factor n=1 Tax=Georhizobium sp. MAB10 TaxID=3028319 RepID=UPI0038558A4D
MSSESKSDLVFKALAAPVRRQICDMLKDDPKTTGALSELLPKLDRCTVMQHLKVLEAAELIVVERRGRERWNHLNPLPIKHIHDRWIGPHAASAVERLARLKSTLEA